MNINKYIVSGRLKITAKPNSPKTEIAGFDKAKQAIKVNVKAQPEKGKANAEIIKFFSKLTKKKVEIVSGLTSKTKMLRFS